MLMQIVSFFFIIGIFSIIFIIPAVLCAGICKMIYGEITIGDKIISYIPIYNTLKSEKLYGNNFPYVTASAFLIIVSIIVRFVVILSNPTAVIPSIITILFFSISILVWYISNIVFTMGLLNYAGTIGSGKKLLMALIFPIGQIYIGMFAYLAMKNEVNKANTFKE